jgi:hypothetical protein
MLLESSVSASSGKADKNRNASVRPKPPTIGMLPRHATFVSNGTAKPIPRCSTPRASHEKSSLSQAQIKRSAKSFRQSSGIRNELTETSLNSRELEDLDKCPSQSIRRKRFHPTTLAVWHARLAPCSWLIICCGPQSTSRP